MKTMATELRIDGDESRKKNSDEEDGREKIPEIVCMPTSIKVFRIYGGFPPKDRLLHPGKMFYIRFIVTAIYSSLILVGSILHLIKSIKGG